MIAVYKSTYEYCSFGKCMQTISTRDVRLLTQKVSPSVIVVDKVNSPVKSFTSFLDHIVV